METITGSISRVRFRNAESGWGVAALDDGTTVVGTIPQDMVESRAVWRLLGQWGSHPRYGEQFQFSSAVREVPADKVALANYLDEAAPHLGPVRSRAVADRYGAEALEILKTDPARVAREVSGITLERATEIRDALLAGERDEQLTLALLEYLGPDGTASIVAKIKDAWGFRAPQRLAQNPYDLTEIWGIGFQTADRIALAHGVERESPKRITAGVRHVLEDKAEQDGHTSLPTPELVMGAADLLGLSPEAMSESIEELIRLECIIVESGHCYSVSTYTREAELAQRIAMLSRAEPTVQPSTDLPDESLYQDQREARTLILAHTVSILTGAPGTGKTHLVKSILASYDGARISLCAPTGKAAKRLSELCGRPASTIHRLLEPVMVRGRFVFTRGSGEDCPACSGAGRSSPPGLEPLTTKCNYCEGAGKTRPLDAEVIVVDEASMVDLRLAWSLFRAIRPGTRVILVGDHHQLPSVGAGNVLRDCLSQLPAYELTEIKRQAAGSLVVQACHRIKDGRTPQLQTTFAGGDLVLVRADSPERIADTIREIVTNRVGRLENPKTGKRYHPLDDVQVITALRKNTMLGAAALNEQLQKAFGRSPELGPFAVGDKVIQLKNEKVQAAYDDGSLAVVNGDFGRVIAIDHVDKKIIVRLENPDRDVRVPAGGEKCNMALAYAVTVHKYQGSQAPVIVLPVHPCLGIMVPQCNWMYTALSRAESLCIVVGHESEIGRIVARVGQRQRHTRLAEKLEEVFSH